MKHKLAFLIAAALLMNPFPSLKAEASSHHSHKAHTWVHAGRGGFIRGRLICARNVSAWLASHGFNSPHSASSKAFLKYRRVGRGGAVYGTVRFNYRRGGGHVMISLGNGMCLNPSSRRQSWVTKPCPAGGIYVKT